jgi:hypothetical protein
MYKTEGGKMKNLAKTLIAIAALSLLTAIVSRVIMHRYIFGITPRAMLNFTGTLLLFVIALELLEK